MRKGKYVSKIKTDHLGKEVCSRTTMQILDLGREGKLSFAFL